LVSANVDVIYSILQGETKMKQQYSCFMRWASRFVIICIISLGMPSSAFAGMVDTGNAVDHALAEQGRAKIMALIDREEVRT
jgi:hypothetical protein